MTGILEYIVAGSILFFGYVAQNMPPSVIQQIQQAQETFSPVWSDRGFDYSGNICLDESEDCEGMSYKVQVDGTVLEGIKYLTTNIFVHSDYGPLLIQDSGADGTIDWISGNGIFLYLDEDKINNLLNTDDETVESVIQYSENLRSRILQQKEIIKALEEYVFDGSIDPFGPIYDEIDDVDYENLDVRGLWNFELYGRIPAGDSYIYFQYNTQQNWRDTQTMEEKLTIATAGNVMELYNLNGDDSIDEVRHSDFIIARDAEGEVITNTLDINDESVRAIFADADKLYRYFSTLQEVRDAIAEYRELDPSSSFCSYNPLEYKVGFSYETEFALPLSDNPDLVLKYSIEKIPGEECDQLDEVLEVSVVSENGEIIGSTTYHSRGGNELTWIEMDTGEVIVRDECSDDLTYELFQDGYKLMRLARGLSREALIEYQPE